jgi:two-component system, cell cycle sensor histidine kinase and response regulator CckA
MFDALPTEIALVGRDGRILAANDAWSRFARVHDPQGFAQGNYLRLWTSPSVIAPDAGARVIDGLRRVLDGDLPRLDDEIAVREPGGRATWRQIVATPFRRSVPADGVVVMQLDADVRRDLVARNDAETARRRSEHKFAALFHASPVAMVISEVTTDRILHVNPAMLALLGKTQAEALGPRASTLEVWGADGQRRDLLERALGGRPLSNVEVALRRSDQSTHTVLLSTELVPPTEDDDSAILITMAVDISERRLLEEQFRQAQKIEAVGRLAGGVAHDFNNLLTVIIGYNESLDFDEALGESARDAVQQIRLATERATTLTRQLLAFSRRQVLQPQTLDLRDVARQLAPMLRRLIGEDVDLLTEWGETAAVVRADPGQIEQVLMNLAVNARDAMPQGGRLTLRIGLTEFGADFVETHPYVVPGRYVELVVSDTGMGMTADTRARIFEPFFTTKPQGQGTGLGLAMVYGIVKQSEGYIWVESEPEEGATFRIALPVSLEKVVERNAAETAKSPSGHETVLVVEDEDALRELDRQILMRCGYRVLHARTGPEALAMAHAHPGPIHMLLTDVVMPNMSGRELADRLQQSHPDIKVLYMSGYTADAVVRHGVSEAQVAFIQKPMSPPELARKVREVLDS